MTAIKTLIFTVLIPGTVAVWVPFGVIAAGGARGSMSLDGFRYAGLPAMLIGASVYLRCAWDFTFAGKGTPAPIDPPKELVVRGLYTYTRNPMYVGVLSVLVGEAIWFESGRLLAYAALIYSFFFAFVVLYEEPALRRKFGDSYAKYCESVPRWLPRLRINGTNRSARR